MTMNKRTSLILAALCAGGTALAGCGTGASDGARTGAPTGDVGSVALALQLAPGVGVNTFSYSITGPSARTGSINVANSTTVSTLVSAIPAGTGYAVTLSGTATDGTTTCSGTSGAFAVVAAQTTAVQVAISCNRAHTTGSVLIEGTINVCPEVTSVSSTPPTGTLIAITSAADDVDASPGPIQYHWTTTSGTLSDASAQNPTLTCTAPGPVTLTLSVTDGDPACGDTFSVLLDCPSDAALNESAWVEIGANNQAIARLITPYTACPAITIDGSTSPMNLRVGPGTLPLRTTSTDPVIMSPPSTNSKPSVFRVSACEINIPPGAHTATVAGKSLPLPKANVQRVIVLGDTGCRISIGNPFQACGDPAQWPFSVISAVAAGMKPDLVVHVGDYQYRDNPCPADQPQCAGTPWGYGYDTWNADLFQPAAPLLAAAPWVMVRGNHESCNRAGQGWYRFLDTNPYSATKNCNDPANDDMGNYNDPWAVVLGDTQVIAFDSSNNGKSAYAPMTKPADVTPFNNYAAELASVASFASNTNLLSIWANHHPVLAYTPGTPVTGGVLGLLSVMSAKYGASYYPPGIGIALHGHVHDFQAINFASGHPATFVAGIGGDNLDATLPDPFPAGTVPATGTTLDKIAYGNLFGFLVMDRVGAQNWMFTAYRRDGSVITQCSMVQPPCSGSCTDPTPGRQISCSNVGSLM
jgi:Calcineurin-like phosphoesterase